MGCRSNTAYLPIGLAVLAILFGGCIAPSPVTPEVRVYEEVRFSDDALVSVGPRRLLKELSERITKHDSNIAPVDGLAFRDTAFPEGGWSLPALIETPERRSSVATTYDAKYLVLVGPARLEEITDSKSVEWAFGGTVATETSTLSAAVIDLRSGEAVSLLVVNAAGTYRMGYFLVYVAGNNPTTEAAVYKGLSEAIVDTVRKNSGGGKVRIALLAAEGASEPFQALD